MKQFFVTLPGNLIGCFRGRRLIWHAAAILLTLVLVMSGLDWHYFLAMRSRELRSLMFPAVVLGMFIPLAVPLALVVTGFAEKNRRLALAGWAMGQAALLGSLISSTYKAFTGRVHPSFNGGVDISHVFRFGFWRGGVFWGWPSSHTTIAFAMAVTVFTLRPTPRWLGWAVLAYAFYIGIGVSMTIHWLSDFAAGAIIGSVIGRVVGASFAPESP